MLSNFAWSQGTAATLEIECQQFNINIATVTSKGVAAMKEWVGLRPGRSTVRLETEVLTSPEGKEFTVPNTNRGESWL